MGSFSCYKVLLIFLVMEIDPLVTQKMLRGIRKEECLGCLLRRRGAGRGHSAANQEMSREKDCSRSP